MAPDTGEYSVITGTLIISAPGEQKNKSGFSLCDGPSDIGDNLQVFSETSQIEFQSLLVGAGWFLGLF